ncbi:hypothetical protein [Halapricum hydrolyticum]|uniref:Uncharacterized protein n=1 Tax=Halapricum hydrolyticum TaxID=2979991 RepID=A0AAE3I8Y7_9EURY|nr:hypothetical protein [Halapricum hydrolyticum]MCU4716818.1 hypothetical protein [Halapricum hydrolyticum]MCU4725577.1 hypothetical protein [Halapricum hydrolyticum]
MSDDTPTRMRGFMAGPFREPEGADQEDVDEAIASLEGGDQS